MCALDLTGTGMDDNSVDNGETGDVGWPDIWPLLLTAEEPPPPLPFDVGVGEEGASMVEVNGSPRRRRFVRCKGGDGMVKGRLEDDCWETADDGNGIGGGEGDVGANINGGDSDAEGDVE